ncbi:hypothetical protein NQ176_g4595 [Zarea fungicola]|uniref:Uncharacterized protein n=1 Tax=Zarea fungicola TaxID=93591 RepID=A0ACC1NDK7_9HYPO|nr:hypothetical protein NQ176_g4595 [Lecanicillium fungicola]
MTHLAESTSTNQSQDKQKKHVEAWLNFFKDNEDGSPPAPWIIEKDDTFYRPHAVHRVTISDVRGEESDFTLDENGFQIHAHTASDCNFLDDDEIKASYYPEVQQLLKELTNASRVFIFDHTVRRQQPSTIEKTDIGSVPLQRVHVDQSARASLSRVSHYLPGDAEELLQGRVQIINVWRPIKAVQRDPLAAMDAKSLSDADLVPVGLIYPNRNGETLHVRYNESQKWFYKSHMTPDEVFLLKCFDSKTDGRARCVPHSAFTDSTAPHDAPTRESIEVRALVFHESDRG